MNKIISIADNATETLDEKLFGGFMKKVTVWNYANISKQSYFSLSHDTRQYYFDMKPRSSGKFGPIYCLF